MADKQFDYAVRTAATLYTAHSYRYTVQFTVQFAATQGGSDDGSSQLDNTEHKDRLTETFYL